jgi:hypothetical protein
MFESVKDQQETLGWAVLATQLNGAADSRKAVSGFLKEYDDTVAARVRPEVRTKLRTGRTHE